MTSYKTIEEEIIAYYKGDSGDWLVEKGKIKEAKLLKEAYDRITKLKKDLSWATDMWREESRKCKTLENSLSEREEALRKKEHNFDQRVSSLYKELVRLGETGGQA